MKIDKNKIFIFSIIIISVFFLVFNNLDLLTLTETDGYMLLGNSNIAIDSTCKNETFDSFRVNNVCESNNYIMVREVPTKYSYIWGDTVGGKKNSEINSYKWSYPIKGTDINPEFEYIWYDLGASEKAYIGGEVIIKEDIKEKNFRVYINHLMGTYSQSIKQTFFKIYISSDKVLSNDDVLIVEEYFKPDASRGGNTLITTLFEVNPSVIEEERYFINYKGKEVKDIKFKNEEMYVIFSLSDGYHKLKLEDARIKPIFSCEINDNEQLMSKTYGELDDIYINDKFELVNSNLEISKFCFDHPVIIQDSSKKASTSTTEPYRLLSQGENLIVPNNQKYTLFFIGKYDKKCGADESYSLDTNKCESTFLFEEDTSSLSINESALVLETSVINDLNENKGLYFLIIFVFLGFFMFLFFIKNKKYK